MHERLNLAMQCSCIAVCGSQAAASAAAPSLSFHRSAAEGQSRAQGSTQKIEFFHRLKKRPRVSMAATVALSFNSGARERSTKLTAAEVAQLTIAPPVYKKSLPSASFQVDFVSDRGAWKLFNWESFSHEVRAFQQLLPVSGSCYSKPALTSFPISDASSMAVDLQSIFGCLGSEVTGYSAISAFGWPSVCVECRDEHRKPLLVGVVEIETALAVISPNDIGVELSSSASQFWPVLNRLRELLILSKLNYGFVTTRKTYWFCFSDDEAGMLAMSPPFERQHATLACFWYLMSLAKMKNSNALVEMPLKLSYIAELRRQTNLADMRARIKSKVRDLETTLMPTTTTDGRAESVGCSRDEAAGIEGKLKFWSPEEFVFGDKLSKRKCDIVRATLQNGEEVVLKIRDLGDPWASVSDVLKTFVKEVLVYKKLHRIQGRAIPELRSYGFMSGCMFAVMVLSSGGQARRFHSLDATTASRYAEAAAHALKMIHERGFVHGDLDTNSVVVRNEEPLRVTIVGLSHAGIASSPKAFSKELVRVKAGCGMDIEDI